MAKKPKKPKKKRVRVTQVPVEVLRGKKLTVAAYTSDLTDIFLFESITGVAAFNITGGGGAGLGASPDYAVQGNNAVDKQISASEKGFMHQAGAAHALGPHDHHYIWITLAVYGLAATRNNRGICACIGDDTSNYVQYHVNGSDTLPFGGALPYAILHVNTALTNRRTVTGSPGTAPDNIGTTANVTGTAKFSNLGADAARFGTGFTITGGTGADPAATLAGMASIDATSAFGIFLAVGGGFNLQGKIRIGQSGTECVLTDSNTNILAVENLEGHVARDFTEIILSDDLTILTLTNVNFEALGSWNRGRLEMVTPLVTAQTDTNYDNIGSNGTFAAGTGYAVNDVITLDDGWTTVTVNSLSGSAVATFTVNSTFGRSAVAGTTMTQDSVAPAGGTGFTLTPQSNNIVTVSDLAFTNVGFIGWGPTIFATTATCTGCRWIGSDQIDARGGVFTNSTVSDFAFTPLIDAQDETSYDNVGNEGTFAAGTGYAVSDIITLSNGATVTVDTLSGSAVATFTVSSDETTDFGQEGVTLTQLSTDGSGTGFTLTPELDNLNDKAAMLWGENLDPNGELDGMTFTKGATASHAIEFGVNSPLNMTLTNVTFSGYSGTDELKDSAIWIRRTSGTVNITITGGTSPSVKSDGATVNIIAGAVTTLVNCKTTGGVNIQNARVFIETSNGTGPFPFEESVTITHVTTTATVTHTGHGLEDNDKVVIRGANEQPYNGVFQITVSDANTYTYIMGSDPGGNATGTIVSSYVALEGLTDASGNISASDVFSTDQPIVGHARRSTTSPFYKTAAIAGTIDTANGFTANVQLILDE
jgi:hypothetical protein